MKILIQVCTISGIIIENGKWLVDFQIPIQQDQTISFNILVKDASLIGYLGKIKSKNCVIDKEGEDYAVSIACKISRIRHMVYHTTQEGLSLSESMAFAVPEDRLAEYTMLYLLMPSACDQKFIAAVRGPNQV